MNRFYFNKTLRIGNVEIHVKAASFMKRAEGQPKVEFWIQAPFRLSGHPFAWFNVTAIIGDNCASLEIGHADRERHWNEKRGWFVDSEGRDYRKDGATPGNA